MIQEKLEPTNLGAIVQLVVVAAIIALLTALFNYFFHNRSSSKVQHIKPETGDVPKDVDASKTDSPVEKPVSKKSQSKKTSKSAAAAKLGQLKFEHSDLVGTLKGHTSEVSDISFSSNGKYMASVSADDRNVIIWSTKEFSADATRNSIRGKVDLDNPVCVDFSPDCRAIAVGMELSNSVRVMKIVKKEGGANQMTLTEGLEFPKVLELDLLNCCVSPSGTFVMVCDNKNSVYILDLKGEVYKRVEAKVGGDIKHCVVSPCGRFVAFCGYNPEMPLYEVDFSTSNVFRGCNRVMILKGHTSSITHFSFSVDAVSIATISRDKTWRLFSLDVRYKDQEEPKLISCGDSGFPANTDLKCLLSCNGKLIGVYSETSIVLKSVTTDETYVTYSDFGTGLSIRKCLTDNSSKHLLVCVGKFLLAIRIKYHIVATIEWLKAELQKPNTSAVKSRLQQQLTAESEKLEALENAPEKSPK